MLLLGLGGLALIRRRR
ncbi:MAG: hypothetical protein ACYTEX_05775 [Planctomycetota bacterium]